MNYPQKGLAQLVIAHCLANDIKDVVISPGSRNAPLTIGFSNHPAINAYSIVDERSAGFFALGIAQRKRKAVAVVCTSGSALLNYYPAVAEAYYSDRRSEPRYLHRVRGARQPRPLCRQSAMACTHHRHVPRFDLGRHRASD